MIAGKIYTVSEVTRIVKGLFRKEPEFANLQIQGEVSNFRQYPSGHCYFNLKDGKTLLKAVMFAGAARRHAVVRWRDQPTVMPSIAAWASVRSSSEIGAEPAASAAVAWPSSETM